MRIYDPRLGKFLSVDPLTKEYPWNSTYSFAENDVIRSIDLDGAEKKTVILYLRHDGTIDRTKTQVKIIQNEYLTLGVHRFASTQSFYLLPSGTILDGGILYERIDRNGKNSDGVYPSAKYNFNEKDPNYNNEMAQRIAEDGGYIKDAFSDADNKRNDSAPERKAAMDDFYAVVELGSNVVDAGVPFIILKAESRIIAHADGTVEYHYTQRDGSKGKIIDNSRKRPEYTNPGHHQRGSDNFRGGGSKKTELLPNNHKQLWEKAIPDVNGPRVGEGMSKNWYAKDIDGSIHRFQTDHNGQAHWSGSTNGSSGLEVPNNIKEQLKK